MTGPPDARKRDKQCEYHKGHGHNTNSCYALKDHLEELVQDDRLTQHVGKNNPSNTVALRSDSPSLGVIHMIYSLPTSSEVHILQLQSSPHSPIMPVKRPHETGRINFDDSDIVGITHRHTDPLIIELHVNRCTIECVLINQCSTSEIMYYKTFVKLGFTDSDLSPANYPFFGFNANPDSQKSAQACYLLIARRPRELEVHSIEVPDRESLKDIGKIPSERPPKP
ncbi:uncharacterized protein LOC114276142 [Camellia sinensis]|uniref:uncharacterized protein LOC114276142 n=1 Tax=Camellia sinensis TaxID=4442 RepID=UPI0010365370|nr:uncharacterized protein LOC114276142 [Camellia sinensis]